MGKVRFKINKLFVVIILFIIVELFVDIWSTNTERTTLCTQNAPKPVQTWTVLCTLTKELSTIGIKGLYSTVEE